jgi:hypothetical protein
MLPLKKQRDYSSDGYAAHPVEYNRPLWISWLMAVFF